MGTPRTKASRKYNEKAYDSIQIFTAKGIKDNWKAEADRRNMSLAQFIQVAVNQYVKCTDNTEVCNFVVQNEKEPESLIK